MHTGGECHGTAPRDLNSYLFINDDISAHPPHPPYYFSMSPETIPPAHLRGDLPPSFGISPCSKISWLFSWKYPSEDVCYFPEGQAVGCSMERLPGSPPRSASHTGGFVGNVFFFVGLSPGPYPFPRLSYFPYPHGHTTTRETSLLEKPSARGERLCRSISLFCWLIQLGLKMIIYTVKTSVWYCSMFVLLRSPKAAHPSRFKQMDLPQLKAALRSGIVCSWQEKSQSQRPSEEDRTMWRFSFPAIQATTGYFQRVPRERRSLKQDIQCIVGRKVTEGEKISSANLHHQKTTISSSSSPSISQNVSSVCHVSSHYR